MVIQTRTAGTVSLMLVKSENTSGWTYIGFFFLSFSLKAHTYYPVHYIRAYFSD